MALALGKQIFNPAGEILSNYDFTDIAAGTGFEVFYGATTFSASGGTAYTLTPNQIYSDTVSSSGAKIDTAASGTTYFKTIDQNFDVSFNLPRIVNGDAIITIPVGANSFNTPTNPSIAFAEVELRKVDKDSAVSVIHSKTSGSLVTSGVGSFKSHLSVFKLPIKNIHFGKDEKLRLNVGIFNRGAGDTVQAYIGHDPQNRTDTVWASEASVMTSNIPFKIDI